MTFRLHPACAAGFLFAGLFASALSIDPVSAHTGATGVVKERMDAMKDMREAMKALNAMLKEGSYDRAEAQKAAFTIRDHSGEQMTGLFPEGSLQHPSESLPTVWEEWPEFAAQAEELRVHADALGAAMGNAAMGNSKAEIPPALQGLSPEDLFRRTARTCKTCHDGFRQD
ncbi:MAG TPA: cytochrome c [Alphaproteobacteria bacterium]|nr:cytochrome c [Alphaproteobacteria bacterium]